MAGEAPYDTASTSRPCAPPIRVLPPELLAEIFEHCTSDSYSAISLSHVSTLWRRTAVTTPRLWHSLSVALPTSSPRTTSAKVRTVLARSGAFPIHVILTLRSWSEDDIPTLALLIHLRNHSGHWARLTLTAASCSITRSLFAFFAERPDMRALTRVDLTAGPSFDDAEDDFPFVLPQENEDPRSDMTAVLAGLASTQAPRLTELNLATSALPYPFWPTPTPLLHLHTLRIFDRNGHLGEIAAPSLLHLLAKCPLLERLLFRGSSSFDPHAPPFGPPVSLPYLQELHLAQTFHQRIILAHLHTPALHTLRLAWLNRPEVLIDESYAPDPAEKNEEPTEYSQSPYTDLLTGAGVRALVRASNPPLRVLDMDFADARSPRDFVWLFGRLPTLEEFKIVGSDMSDRVLDALAGRGEDGTWLCPRLVSLDFSRCDVITGKGVVELAKARNPPLDVGIDNAGAPARLTRFNVEACARVDCEAVAVKQYILGDVSFEVEVVPSLLIYPEEGVSMPT
ncbi:hypothetical protein K439DRAFT_1642895 [Ramaria rubella]|nr:hypothetical protein K439DRAFT_1642895 [Ramaria rubella]